MLKKLLCTLCAVPVLALAAPRTAKAVPAEGPVHVDGVLSESSWQKAPVQTGFTVMGGKEDPVRKPVTPKEDMRFRVLKGERGLYFGIEAVDSTLKTQKRELNGPLWFDDCVELFLAPEKEFSQDKNIREFYQFIVNASGSRFAQKNIGGVDVSWSCNWHAAAKTTKTGWTAEIYIPFYPFAETRSDVWRLNIGHDNIGSKETHSAWSPVRVYRLPDQFGYLEGVSFDKSFYAPAFRDVKMENNTLTGKIEGKGNRDLAVKVFFRQGRKFAGMLAENIGKDGKFSIPVKLPDGKYSMELLLTDRNWIISSMTRNFLYTDSPVRVNVLRPWYRETLYPDEPEEFLAEVRFPGKVKSSEFTLLDSKGKKLESKTVKEGEKLTFSLKGLPAGEYQIKGEKYLYSLTIFKGSPFIRIDSGNHLIVNGKPFYTRGFMGCGPVSPPILHKNGYNLAHFYTLHYKSVQDIRKQLDEAQKQNVMVLMSPFHKSRGGFFGFKNKDGLFERMTDLVNSIKDHPALFGWYLYDEPRGADYAALLKDAYLHLRKIDPAHPVVGCDNSPGGCIAKSGHCDIHALDMYPSPNAAGVMSIPIASVTKGAEAVVSSVGREMLWYVPQAFDRDSFGSGPQRANARGLNVQEIRASVYGTLAAGAEGIMPYKIGDPSTKVGVRHSNSGIWASEEMKTGYLKKVGPELKELEKVLLSPSFKPQGTGLMRGWHAPDGDRVIVVNPEPAPGKAVLDHPSAFREFHGTRTFPKGKKTFSMDPYEVLILAEER